MPTVQTSRAVLDVLGTNVRKLREERGLSQVQLAKAARMQPSDVSRIENGLGGSRGIGLARIQRLARALKVSASQLLAA